MHEKIWKCHTKIINLKYQLRPEIKSLNYLMGHILYQIFKITLNIIDKFAIIQRRWIKNNTCYRKKQTTTKQKTTLATECTFKFNSRFLKQLDGCTMGGPLSFSFSDIYMVKMDNDVVIPSKPIFYRTFVDDIYSRRKLRDNVLLDWSNSYHPNIKFTIEVNPSKFLDNKLTNINGTYKFNIYWWNTKLPSPWTSKIPKRWNANNGDLHLSKRISSNFDEEIPLIKKKFMKADYPLLFINSVVYEFQKGK